MKGVTIFLAEGFEDMEAIATRDVLIRAGINVNLVSITDEYVVESSHGLTVSVDSNRGDFEFEEEGTSREDVMIFPGGMPGTRHLSEDADLIRLMREHYQAGGTVAAICAAPGLVLSQLDSLEGVRFTCFDGFEDGMTAKGAVYTPERAVVHGRIITGRGAGCAVDFGLAIVEYLRGPEAAAKVRHGLMLD
ncbi:MAG: DJ-1/PfpI family protein [Bacteroidales bacterium]|nr:DJ-1/PfpI family protein [Bacteroidales bacterium]